MIFYFLFDFPYSNANYIVKGESSSFKCLRRFLPIPSWETFSLIRNFRSIRNFKFTYLGITLQLYIKFAQTNRTQRIECRHQKLVTQPHFLILIYWDTTWLLLKGKMLLKRKPSPSLKQPLCLDYFRYLLNFHYSSRLKHLLKEFLALSH